MKVYYEKPNAIQLLQEASELAESYEAVTGKTPNRIEMSTEEFKIISDHLSTFAGFRLKESSEVLKNQIYGMEIIINDN